MSSNNLVKFVNYLLALNAAWHGAAAYYFTLKPRGILRKHSNTQPPIPQLAIDVLRFLGGINTGYVLLALLALKRSLQQNKIHSSDLWVLSLANFSQFIGDLFLHSNGTARRSFLQITIPDGAFALVDGICAYLIANQSK